MQESKKILAYEEPSKPFAGVRFALYGFDSDKKEKILSRLLVGGGLDAVNYGPDCTHVIVNKLVYDDPVCLSARRHGKTLVTGLWVEHSFDLGMPVDPTSVIYRPVRDFKGISGAQSLIVCLTGYQRQDRDDIMAMVGLMGASFSKPLVANKVTHLICYKFEGEKYELAKKIKKIKLVNHRWLEDCLKAWKILPEVDYCKSGFELEMVAEAKDSEDDAEDVPSVVDVRRNYAASTQHILVQSKISYESPKKIVGNGLCLTEPTNWATVSKAAQLTPGKANYFDTASVLDETNQKQFDLSISYSARSQGKMSFQMPSSKSDMVSRKVETDLDSTSDFAQKTPDAIASKSSSMNHCSSTSGKSSLPLRSKEKETTGGNASVLDVDKLLVGSGFNISLKAHEDETDLSGVKTPIKGTMLDLENHQTATSSKKRKTSAVNVPSLSPKISRLSKTLMESESMEKTGKVLASGSVKGSRGKGLAVAVSPLTDTSCLREDVSLCPKEALHISKTATSEDGQEYGEVAVQHSLEGGKKRRLSTNREMKEFPFCQTKFFNGEIDTHQSNILSSEPALPRTNSVTEKSNGSGGLEFSNELSDPSTEPLEIKMQVKKTLGSRPSLFKGGTAKHKGSMNLKKVLVQNEDLINSVEVEATVDIKNATTSEKVGMFPPTNIDPTQKAPVVHLQESREMATNEDRASSEETKDPEDKVEIEVDLMSNKGKATEVESPNSGDSPGICNAAKQAQAKSILPKEEVAKSGKVPDFAEADKVTHRKKIASTELIAADDTVEEILIGDTTCASNKSKTKKLKDTKKEAKKNGSNSRQDDKKVVGNTYAVTLAGKTKRPSKKLKRSADTEKENEPVTNSHQSPINADIRAAKKAIREAPKEPQISCLKADKTNCNLVNSGQNLEPKTDPAWFILSGHKLQRKEFQHVIRRLKGRVCRDSHHWSYQATHFIVPDPIRRTEKFFAAAASGSWILKTEYLTASNEAGRFLPEESFEWHKKCLSEDGAINLEVPRKWRLVRQKTGHGAFYGMRIAIYGECIAPSLDTLKCVVKAGDGTILATSPPYTRFLQSRIDFAIVSPGMPRVDMWVQEFLRHNVPCVLADYLVEYVCKPGFSLDRHVQYNTHDWAKKALDNHVKRVEEVSEDARTPENHSTDITCQVCGSGDRGEEILICGDESGTSGCGVGAHLDCLDPPLMEVPEEDWFCASCCMKKESSKSISQSHNKRSSNR